MVKQVNTKGSTALGARVVKAIGVFSSVEFIKLLCGVIRTKLVAVLIGAAGVGVISLYNSTLEMLRSVAMLNLGQSAVREISTSGGDCRAAVAHEVERTGLWLGIMAAVVTALLSPLLSLLAFGSPAHSWAFCVLSLSLLAGAVTDARTAVLQSFGQIKFLARVSLLGAVSGTLLAVPTYIMWRMDGIVPVILIYSATTLFFLMRYKVSRPEAVLSRSDAKALRRRLIGLGAWLTVASAMGFAALYILRIWLNAAAGVDAVGKFQAGFTIVNTYAGVLFTAIAMEFYPRLAGVIRSGRATSVMVGHEIAIALWILIAVVPVFLCLQTLIVRVLYSSEFLIVLQFTAIAIGATIFRAISWCFSYVILARADGRVYLITEGASAVSLVVFGAIGWTAFGFYGLGLAYLLQYVLFTIVTALVYFRRYRLNLPRAVSRLIVLSVVVVLGSILIYMFLGLYGRIVIFLLIPVVIYFAYKNLRNIMA